MRIFEKISRRLSITLAGVMACSSFAMAPAITAYAEGLPTDKEMMTAYEKLAIELKNEADYVDGALKAYENVTYEGEPVEEYIKKTECSKAYKVHSDIEGKLNITILAKDETSKLKIAFWKSGDEKFIEDLVDQSIQKDKTFEKTIDVKDGDYYFAILNADQEKEFKYQIKATVNTTGKESKIRNAESPAKKTAKVTIKKAKKVDGYEVRFSTSKDFDKNVKKKSVKAKKIEFKDKKGTIEKNGLKSGKKYYVQVRTYIKKNGVKYYSEWSKSKKISKVK